MTGTEIYKRTAAYEKQAREIRLLAPHWKLLLAYDGLRSLSEVAISAETSFADAIPLTEKFLGEGWIEEQPITLDQYIKRTNTKDISGTSAAVAPAVVLHEPSKEKPAASPVVASAPAPTPTPSISATATIPPPLPAAPPKVVPAIVPVSDKPTVVIKSSHGAMKLSAIVDFITSVVGNVSLGQLLVYRVFLRVPPDLLLAEDIASVHLVNDTSLIQSEKLQSAIADAVNAVTKRALPDSVYASA